MEVSCKIWTTKLVAFIPIFYESIFPSGGNGKFAEKLIEMRRAQADVKSVEAALNLQSQNKAKLSENTDESATLTSTEDDAAKQSDEPSGKVTHVRFNID